MQIAIAMPVYEDWDAAMALCQKIDLIFRKENSAEKRLHLKLLLIDDGSTTCARPCKISFHPEAIENISILALRRNLGHQRAIAVGLAHMQRHWKSEAAVVMDADGQ